MGLQDKVSIITGGGSGIGRAAALLMASGGSKVVLAGRTESKVVAVRDEVRKAGGVAEAFAIERRIKRMEISRPMTHELLSATIVALGATLERIVIHDLADGTFYAMLCLQRGDEEIQVDARPSDAIALAVGADVPILVSEAIIDEIEREGGMPGFDPPVAGGEPGLDEPDPDDDPEWA